MITLKHIAMPMITVFIWRHIQQSNNTVNSHLSTEPGGTGTADITNFMDNLHNDQK